MIGCLRKRVRKQPIIGLYFEFENELKFYNLKARTGPYVLVLASCLLMRCFQSAPQQLRKIVWFSIEENCHEGL